MLHEVIDILPAPINGLVIQMDDVIRSQLEEIRIRVDRPVEFVSKGKPYYPLVDGRNYTVTSDDAKYILSQLSEYSMYAFEEELKNGYITIRGGHRVGLAGKVILNDGAVKTLRDISSFNIRIARQTIGVANPLVSELYKNGWLSTLFIGPPQSGKTTLLRDVARLISSGVKKSHVPPQKVGIVDERSEIAASIHGIPQHDLGVRIDVLDGCPKAEGMMMLIRAMSPDVLVVDEIGRVEDVKAIQEALHAGVKVMATAHGYSVEDVRRRPELDILFKRSAFDRFVELSRTNKPGTIRRITGYDGNAILQ